MKKYVTIILAFCLIFGLAAYSFSRTTDNPAPAPAPADDQSQGVENEADNGPISPSEPRPHNEPMGETGGDPAQNGPTNDPIDVPIGDEPAQDANDIPKPQPLPPVNSNKGRDSNDRGTDTDRSVSSDNIGTNTSDPADSESLKGSEPPIEIPAPGELTRETLAKLSRAQIIQYLDQTAGDRNMSEFDRQHPDLYFTHDGQAKGLNPEEEYYYATSGGMVYRLATRYDSSHPNDDPNFRNLGNTPFEEEAIGAVYLGRTNRILPF